jgi:hypothetical protein
MHTGYNMHVTFYAILALHSQTPYDSDTTHAGHALELSREMNLGYDALVVVSGDGLIHEVLNGIYQHQYRDEAFSIPIAPIPTGSANAMSLNLLGLQDGLDVCAAALNVLKGASYRSSSKSGSLTTGARTTIKGRSLFIYPRKSTPDIIHVTIHRAYG